MDKGGVLSIWSEENGKYKNMESGKKNRNEQVELVLLTVSRISAVNSVDRIISIKKPLISTLHTNKYV